MKLLAKAIPLLVFLHTGFNGYPQITKLANNNNIEGGLPLGSIAILYDSSDSLWRTDGTALNTFKYAPNVALDSPYQVTLFQNKVFFAGITAANGKELWVTDGTPGGTQLVKDIIPGAADGNPMNFMVFNNMLYFIAQTPAQGFEVWQSDGTTAGTVILKDINLGPGSSVGNTTTLSPNSNYFYFGANDGTLGVELWRSDGTPGGTISLGDLNLGPLSSNPMGFTNYGLSVIFNASDATHGAELWKSDGSPGGTFMVKDIATGFFGSNPSLFLLYNNKIYFNALDFTNGFEPWVTDGTTLNTTLLKDIDPGFNSSFPILVDAVFFGSKFYFPASTTANGDEIWSSDGTGVNTTQFMDINPGAGNSSPLFLIDFMGGGSMSAIRSKLFNGKMFMNAYTPANGRELWVTDFSVPGTTMVKDINPGADSSVNDSLTYFYTSNALYFAATDGLTGYELWKSDGSFGNTTRVMDIYPGNPGSYPQFITAFNGIYLFTAHDGDNPGGLRDLFRLDGTFTPLPISSMEFSASRFFNSAKLIWTTISEINTSVYQIERSGDGSHFITIGSIPAQGNSSRKYDYYFTDPSAFSSATNELFYRLKIIDRDGKFSYSNVIALTADHSSGGFYTWPNPVKDQLTLVVPKDFKRNIAVEIVDESGTLLYRRVLTDVPGGTSYNINVSSFPNAVYFIKLSSDEGSRRVKFIKN